VPSFSFLASFYMHLSRSAFSISCSLNICNFCSKQNPNRAQLSSTSCGMAARLRTSPGTARALRGHLGQGGHCEMSLFAHGPDILPLYTRRRPARPGSIAIRLCDPYANTPEVSVVLNVCLAVGQEPFAHVCMCKGIGSYRLNAAPSYLALRPLPTHPCRR
jgi:hypothetical protein